MRITIQENTITGTLKKLETFVSIPQMQKQIGVVALAGVQRNFVAGGRSQSGSTGVWTPLQQITKDWRRGHGGGIQILRDTGILMNGIHPEFTGNNVEISTSDQANKYAAPQHFGFRTPRAGAMTPKQIAYLHYRGMHLNWGKITHGLKIPARPYMILPDPAIREMNAISAKFKV